VFLIGRTGGKANRMARLPARHSGCIFTSSANTVTHTITTDRQPQHDYAGAFQHSSTMTLGAIMRQRLRIHRAFAAFATLCLLSTMITPAIAFACEGASGEYEGETSAKEIAGGNNTSTVNFEFEDAVENQPVKCEEKYTWGAQPERSQTFTVTPSYTNCKYKTENNVPVEIEKCSYQLNQPFELDTNLWQATLSITGMGCELKMELEAKVCKVKITSQNGLSRLLEENENNGTELKVSSFVKKVAFTPEKCGNPIGAAGAELRYTVTHKLAGVHVK
jgi:hypothetical protein